MSAHDDVLIQFGPMPAPLVRIMTSQTLMEVIIAVLVEYIDDLAAAVAIADAIERAMQWELGNDD